MIEPADRDTAAAAIYGPGAALARLLPWCWQPIEDVAALLAEQRQRWFTLGVEIGYGARKDPA